MVEPNKMTTAEIAYNYSKHQARTWMRIERSDNEFGTCVCCSNHGKNSLTEEGLVTDELYDIQIGTHKFTLCADCLDILRTKIDEEVFG